MKITVNGIDVALPPLTYGAVKANKATIDQVTTEGLTYDQRVEAAIALLRLSAPSLDADAVVPSVLLTTAQDLYTATFYRPEGAAPAIQAP